MTGGPLLYSYGLQQKEVSGCCEDGNEPSGSVIFGQIFLSSSETALAAQCGSCSTQSVDTEH
jgi:hypothetical protein